MQEDECRLEGVCGFGEKRGTTLRGNFGSEVLRQVEEARSAKRREVLKAGLLPRRSWWG